MYYFLSGYTAKVAGTERGIKEPVPSFSACFGAAFLMLDPIIYARELSRKMKAMGASAWLVNTGWIGGPYGSGKRIDLPSTRKIINSILDESILQSAFKEIPVFNFSVPEHIDGIDSNLLIPSTAWESEDKWTTAARELARKFLVNFCKFTTSEETSGLVKYGPES
jgi:phosphoenolpyruvate carboxykinase (ATP)